MDPTRATADAFEKLDRVGDSSSERVLHTIVERVLEVVPECVGLSLTLIEDAITLTMISSDLDVAQLDAMQYLGGGPCVEAVHLNTTVKVPDLDALDEDQWSLFARAGAAHGVRSTLSLSISDGEHVVGGINLYAGAPEAFDGHIDQLAAALHADAASAVRDSDLTFATRRTAEDAPEILAAEADIQTAAGILVTSARLEPETARTTLLDAAAKAGLPVRELARTIIAMHARPEVP